MIQKSVFSIIEPRLTATYALASKEDPFPGVVRQSTITSEIQLIKHLSIKTYHLGLVITVSAGKQCM